MAMRLILKVEDVFDIPGRGLTLAPKIPDHLGFAVRPKDRIQLRTPNGRLLDTYIASFSLGKPIGGGPTIVAIELPSDIRREDVPIGTEVWFLLPNE
jgi:hypothetical protein